MLVFIAQLGTRLYVPFKRAKTLVHSIKLLGELRVEFMRVGFQTRALELYVPIWSSAKKCDQLALIFLFSYLFYRLSLFSSPSVLNLRGFKLVDVSKSQPISIPASSGSFVSGWSPGETLGKWNTTYFFWLAVSCNDLLFCARNPGALPFHYPRVSPGDQPLTKSLTTLGSRLSPNWKGLAVNKTIWSVVSK